jgi:hypothetical protein
LKYIIYIVAIVFFFVACKKQEQKIVSYTKSDDYSGLKVGNVSYYNVRYILHDAQVDRHDTIDFKMKSLIEDTFRDNTGNLRYKIHRFRWNDTIASWVNLKVFSAFIKNQYYVENEDNILKKKLSIPYVYNFAWNSDSYNVNDTMYFRYGYFYPSLEIKEFKVDSVIHVKQQFYQTYVDLKRKNEFFAKNKGLVIRSYKDLKIKKGDTTNVDKGEEWFLYMYQFELGK